MSDRPRGLGKGLGALIPSGAPDGEDAARPVDVFFTERRFTGNHHQRAPMPDVFAPRARVAQPPHEPTGPDEGSAELAEPTATVTQPARHAAAVVPEPDEQDAALAAPVGEHSGTPTAAELVEVPGASFAELPVDLIRANPRQPRTVFDEDALAELVESVRLVGVLQPVVVRRVDDAFELIMGERRLRASREAGLDLVPAIIRDVGDDALLRDALLENLHRADLNPLEEAAAYQQLLDDFDCTHDELAARIGRSRPHISNTLRLLKLPALVQRRVAAGVLSAGHARALLGLPDGAAMERLAQRIVAEGLSVRGAEEVVALGGEPDRPPSRKATRPDDTEHPESERLSGIAAKLAERLETSVHVTMGRTKGRLTVDFADADDLDRIVRLLS
ncbi:MAG: chromosome partitioning protein ParB [Micrococcales bacterium]|nr:MAG: chromosome partitioning protein ParB [Micrococcales bacterium]PIE27020.1 MAG: chromosome partitioning protein ParB [Micrococcales bacterium]